MSNSNVKKELEFVQELEDKIRAELLKRSEKIQKEIEEEFSRRLEIEAMSVVDDICGDMTLFERFDLNENKLIVKIEHVLGETRRKRDEQINW